MLILIVVGEPVMVSYRDVVTNLLFAAAIKMSYSDFFTQLLVIDGGNPIMVSYCGIFTQLLVVELDDV